MLPSQFYSAYGQPAVRRLTVNTTYGIGGTIIGADPDRYLIAFFPPSQPMHLEPMGQDAQVYDSLLFQIGDQPIIYTHALHGTLTSIAWRVSLDNPGLGTVTVIESFMRPNRVHGGVSHAKKGRSNIHTVRGVR